MKKIIIPLSIILLLVFLVLAWKNKQSTISNSTQPANVSTPQNTPIISSDIFLPPLNRAKERVTKKMFGTYITPQNSPVQPERFTGFHTGVDFEIFPEEADKDVVIKAVCNGKLIQKKSASGYGGVVVQSCNLNGQPITVVYGHLKLASINQAVDTNITVGEEIGILGKAYSLETDGERKHLHLAFHKENQINLLGYVPLNLELSEWLDPCLYVCK